MKNSFLSTITDILLDKDSNSWYKIEKDILDIYQSWKSLCKQQEYLQKKTPLEGVLVKLIITLSA